MKEQKQLKNFTKMSNNKNLKIYEIMILTFLYYKI